MWRILVVALLGFVIATSVSSSGNNSDPGRPSGLVVIDTSDDSLPADSFRALDSLPQLIHESRPEYPQADKEAGIMGKIWLKFLINKQGLVRRAFVLKREEGSVAMENVAIAAALTWNFRPGMVNGKPMACWVTAPISFRLSPKQDSTTTKPPDSK